MAFSGVRSSWDNRDDRLSGEGLEERDLALRERTRAGASRGHRTDSLPLLQHRHGDAAPKGCPRLRRDPVLGVVSNVRDMDDAVRQDGPSGCTPVARRHWEGAPDRSSRLRVDVRQRGNVNELAVEPHNCAGACPAQVHRTLGDCVEHWLDIGRRARDHPQDVGRGRLLLERLFRLVEQPNVLDRDHGLVGEGLEQGDLPVQITPGLGTPNGDRPEDGALSQQRHHEDAPVSGPRRLLRDVVHRKHVRYVNEAPLEDRASGEAAGSARTHGKDVEDRRIRIKIARHGMNQFSVEDRDGASGRLA
jgi:hypothetical protein